MAARRPRVCLCVSLCVCVFVIVEVSQWELEKELGKGARTHTAGRLGILCGNTKGLAPTKYGFMACKNPC